VNDGSPRTPPISTVQSAAGRVVADTVSAARRIFDSGTKVARRNKNRDSLDTVQQDSIDPVQQGSVATVQQDDASTMIQQDDTSTTIQQDATSMTVNTPSINTPDGSNSGNNAGQEHSAIDVLQDASFLSDLGSRATSTQAEMNTMDGLSPVQGPPSQSGFSPVQGQNLSPSQDESLQFKVKTRRLCKMGSLPFGVKTCHLHKVLVHPMLVLVVHQDRVPPVTIT